MNEREAIEILDTFYEMDEVYEATQIAIQALEKQIPKKVKGLSLTHEGSVGNCPSCGKFITHRESECVCGYENCLQRLDWSDEE